MPSLKKKTSLFLRPLVGQLDADARVEERQLAQPLGQDLVLEFARGQEDLRVGLEGDLGAGLLGVADHRHLLDRLALRKAHLVDLAAAPHLGLEPFGDGVDAFCADAVQPAGHLVGALAELSAGMEVGQDELQRGNLVDRVRVDGNAAAVVLDRAGAVQVDGDLDRRGEARQGLVDRVVDDLEDAVVQPPLVGVADVHVRALAHPLETLEFLDF